MRLSLLSLSCVCAQLACGPPTPASRPAEEQAAPNPPEAVEPGPRRAIAGLAGFVSRSTLTFADQPDVPTYSLETVYVFPQRVRWRTEPQNDELLVRQPSMRFQYGTFIWQLPAGTSESKQFLGEEARFFQLQFEARRVAMTWPAGLEWTASEDDHTRQALLPGLGSLRARLDAKSGALVSLASYLPEEDEVFDLLADITWRADGRRSWPASWTLHHRGKPVWRETLDEVQTGRKYLESFFRPADRREGSALESEPAAVKLAARVYRRTKLQQGIEWPAALELGRAAAVTTQAELGDAHVLDPRPAFQLDAQGKPQSFEFKLRGEVPNPPEGWQRSPARAGWSVVLHGLDDLNEAALAALSNQLETDERAGTPYVRVQYEEQQVGVVQLVLPVFGSE